MKWKRDDLKKYTQAKEYIDTIIIPIQAFQLSQESNLEKDAFQTEILSIYTNEVEKELSGRVLLSPIYTYLITTHMENEVIRINEWINDIQTQPFKFIFVLTFDSGWKKVEQAINGNLIWLPSMKPTDINSEGAVSLIRSQVEQISDLIRSYW